jgi:uncharacterized OB-fold protein
VPDSDEIPWDDGTTEPFWRGAQAGILRVQRCESCGHHQHHPRPLCRECHSTQVGWVDCAGTGTVYSFSEVHLAVHPEIPPPYTVAIVDLDEEGARIMAPATAPVAIGDRVRVGWRPRAGMPPFPEWEPLPPAPRTPV